MTKAIPIENIYYLLSYAWDVLEEKELASVTVQPTMRLQDLLARVLVGGVTHLLKRGLDRTYLAREEEIAGVRGRLLVGRSIKQRSFERARAWCGIDELSPDVLHNQLVRTTLRRLASVDGLDGSLADQLRDLYRRMPGVSEVGISSAAFRRVTLGRNTKYYRFLLDVCEIAHRNLLVDESTGCVSFRDFTRDDAQMANLFERFLFNFFRRERPDLDVGRPHLQWNAEGSEESLAYLPGMRTDIVLRDSERTIVIDAKYYSHALSEHFGKRSLHSENLYQLFAYMRHLAMGKPAASVTGMLVYPRTTETVRVDVAIFGHPVVATALNLSQSWPELSKDLLDLLPAAAG